MNPEPYGIADLWSQGDAVIRGVAIVLLLMSVVSWTLILVMAWRAVRMRRAARASAAFWHTGSFAEGMALLERHGPDSPFRRVAAEGRAAVDHHASSTDDLHGQLSLAEWLTGTLRAAIDECAERLSTGLAVLASVGSTAPFVGLFGTVWGIYRALLGIGASGQPGIDKVAGPVGEALIMTAFGLAVAIPAVLGYNALLRSNRRTVNQLNRFARQLHAYFLTGSPLGATPSNVTPLRRREG